MHALILEDEMIIALDVEGCLRDIGFRSFRFAAAEEQAVSGALDPVPNLIVADYRLLAGDGVSAVVRILHQLSGRMPPVIFLTGNKALAMRATDELMRAGAITRFEQFRVLAKPFDQREFRRAVHALTMQNVVDLPIPDEVAASRLG